MRFRLQFEILSHFEYLPFLTRIFKGLKVPKAPVLTQILVEAYNNAVIHGHRKNKAKWIEVAIIVTQKGTKIRVSDDGSGIKNLKQGTRKSKSWKTSGRGLQIIHTLAKQVTSKKEGRRHIFEATV